MAGGHRGRLIGPGIAGVGVLLLLSGVVRGEERTEIKAAGEVETALQTPSSSTQRKEANGPEPAWKAKLPFKVEGELEAGFQTLGGNTGSPTLHEYRDLAGKPTIPNLRVRAEDRLSSQFLELGGTNMTRTDGSFYLSAGQYNALQFDFGYDRLPHVIGLNRTTIFSHVGDGRFVLPPGPPTAGSFIGAGLAPGQRNAVESSVNGLLQPTRLGFQTDTATMAVRYLPFPNLELTTNYTRMNKAGTRPFGGVIGTPGSHVLEFAAPRHERIHDVGTGAEYAKDWYQIRFNYTASLFENSFSHVEWDNVCGTGPVCGNPSGIGRTAMMPNNLAHTFSSAGGASLPWWHTRMTGSLSYSLWRQDQTFMPLSTLTDQNRSDLGRASPNAAMNVLATTWGLTSRPLSAVTLAVRYRYYHLDNATPMHTFTGVVPGDTGIGQTVRNLPISFRKQNLTTDAAWRLTSRLTAKIGYEWERWGRSFREVAQTDEHITKAALDYRPSSWSLSRLTYSHGVRTIGGDGYVQVSPITAVALPQFRKFDQADRTRDKAEWFVQFTPTETVTVSGLLYGQLDHYFDTSYGLQNSRAYGYSTDVSWAAHERLSVFSGYAHDDYQSQQQNCHIGFPAITCAPVNTYVAQPRDLLDTWYAGMGFTAVPGRLDLGVEYRYAFGRSKYGMSGVPGGALAGQPVPMPEIKNVFHVINASARYYLAPEWTLKVVYLYERYLQTDFTVDNVTPSLANVVVDGFITSTAADVRSVLIPILHPGYEAHFLGFSVAYRF